MSGGSPRTIEQLVKYLEHLAREFRGATASTVAVNLWVTPPDVEVIQQAADLLRPAINPRMHLGTGGADPHEKRYTARDVEAIVEIVMALHRTKKPQDI